MEIEDWVTDMAKKCYEFRGIETSLKRIDAIIEHINSDGRYDELSKITAKNWILYGDWTYRRNEQLTLNDFYPSYEQVSRGLSKLDFVVMTKEELQLKIQKAMSYNTAHETTTNVEYEPMPMPKKETRELFTMDMLNRNNTQQQQQ
jgi:hypothetical protein